MYSGSSVLVFIVRGIDPELLRRSFHAYLAIK